MPERAAKKRKNSVPGSFEDGVLSQRQVQQPVRLECAIVDCFGDVDPTVHQGIDVRNPLPC